MSPKPVSYKIEQFTGMYHSLTGNTPSPDVLWFIENLIPVNGMLMTRPGLSPGGVVGTAGVGQGMAQFVDGGTERLIAVTAGELYDVSGTTWTRRVTAAVIAAAGITFSTTARVYMTQLGEYLHFTDGTNVPFQWDGTAGGGVTVLTASPVLYGQPTIYYGKLFGIKNTDRQMIVWCEENLLTTGYEAGGYTNRWALTQTGGGKLWAIKGTNEALYYWRASNIGAINGEVGSNFTTTGVHDAVSLERGSQNTESVAAFNGVWFYDEQRRPAVIKNGVVIDLWPQIPAAIGAYVDSGGSAVSGVGQPYRSSRSSTLGIASIPAVAGTTTNGVGTYPALDAVIFWYTGVSGTTGLLAVVVHGPTNRVLCYFTVPATVYTGGAITGVVTLESTGDHYLFQSSTFSVAKILAAADIGRAMTAVGDTIGAGALIVNPTIRFIAGRMAETPAINCHFDTLRLEVERETTDVATIGVQRYTSIEQTNALLPAEQTFAPTVDTKETHLIGMTAYGRWIAPVVTVNHTATTARSPVRFYRLEVDGFVDAPADAVS